MVSMTDSTSKQQAASRIDLRCPLRISVLLLSVCGTFLVIEAGLRLFPGVLPDELAHAAFSRYDSLPSGIYRFEGITRMRFMRSNQTTSPFSNGRFWSHSTDSNGFRNSREIAAKQILLLGDSLIYGHGVDDDATLAQRLRDEHGVAAYDMSAQGQCLYEHYVLLRLHLETYRPDVVALFVFVNDVRDLERRGRAATGGGYPEIVDFDYPLIRSRVERLQHFRDSWIVRLAWSSAVYRMVARTRGWKPHPPPESSAPEEWRSVAPKRRISGPDDVPGAVLDDARFRPVAGYYESVLADLSKRCGDVGARLVVIHLVPPSESVWRARERAQTKLERELQRICERLSLEFVDTRAFFSGHHEWILPGDGHLNPAGHRALARFLANEVFLPRPSATTVRTAGETPATPIRTGRG